MQSYCHHQQTRAQLFAGLTLYQLVNICIFVSVILCIHWHWEPLHLCLCLSVYLTWVCFYIVQVSGRFSHDMSVRYSSHVSLSHHLSVCCVHRYCLKASFRYPRRNARQLWNQHFAMLRQLCQTCASTPTLDVRIQRR